MDGDAERLAAERLAAERLAAERLAIDDSDQLRAHGYRLLARLLARPPTAPFLIHLATLRGDDTPLGQAFTALGETARKTGEAAAEREYHDLFIGLVRGELVPYASFYLTGFLNDRPLARLRHDMRALGIERTPQTSEPEDHIAALCEMMAGLILGQFGAPAGLDTQRRFCERHLMSWAGRFFQDLEQAGSTRLYRPVGRLGRLFLDIEADAFTLAPAP